MSNPSSHDSEAPGVEAKAERMMRGLTTTLLLALTVPASAVEAPRLRESGDRQPPPRELSEQGERICWDRAKVLGWTAEQLAQCFREKRIEERMMRGERPR